MAQHDPASGCFLPGNTEYRRKQQRIAERLAELRQQYEQSPLLIAAAKHLIDAERARNTLDRTRASNCAARLLARVPLKPEPQVQPPTWADYQARKRKRGRK